MANRLLGLQRAVETTRRDEETSLTSGARMRSLNGAIGSIEPPSLPQPEIVETVTAILPSRIDTVGLTPGHAVTSAAQTRAISAP